MMSGGSLRAPQPLVHPLPQVCLLKIWRRKHPGQNNSSVLHLRDLKAGWGHCLSSEQEIQEAVTFSPALTQHLWVPA